MTDAPLMAARTPRVSRSAAPAAAPAAEALCLLAALGQPHLREHLLLLVEHLRFLGFDLLEILVGFGALGLVRPRLRVAVPRDLLPAEQVLEVAHEAAVFLRERGQRGLDDSL